jgi:uncharacterized protein (UPF0335 family)
MSSEVEALWHSLGVANGQLEDAMKIITNIEKLEKELLAANDPKKHTFAWKLREVLNNNVR